MCIISISISTPIYQRLALSRKGTTKQMTNSFFATLLYFKLFNTNSTYIYIYYLLGIFGFRLNCSLNKSCITFGKAPKCLLRTLPLKEKKIVINLQGSKSNMVVRFWISQLSITQKNEKHLCQEIFFPENRKKKTNPKPLISFS